MARSDRSPIVSLEHCPRSVVSHWMSAGLAFGLAVIITVMRRRACADSALDAVLQLLRFGNAHVRRRRLNWSRSTPAVHVWGSIYFSVCPGFDGEAVPDEAAAVL
jgi:hypothetical protein